MAWFTGSKRKTRRPRWWRFTFFYTVYTWQPDRLNKITFRGHSKIHTVWERS